MPPPCKGIKITDEDIQKFFEYSDKGLHKADVRQSHFSDGFNALVAGKKWRGIHMHELYEPGILEGTTPYLTLLGGFEGARKWFNPMRYTKGQLYHKPVPRPVVDFMKKELFKGKDADVIEAIYQEVIKR